jgi:pyruvate/2-oxoglutarate dehydrogenase complex dihydrolipoamide dehydrogenase (E3) component
MKDNVFQPDLCILGAGAAGLALATSAAACGLSVTLVEKDQIGGERLRNAIPGHALRAAGHFAAALRRAPQFGIDFRSPDIDFARVGAHAAAVATGLEPGYAQIRLEGMNMKVIKAAGRFTRSDVLEAGGVAVKARNFVVATGSRAKSMAIPGLDLVRPLNAAALCALASAPRRLIVIGGDPNGMALAQGVRRLGSEVIVLSEAKILAAEDQELVAPVRTQFARDGIVLREGVRISHIEPEGEGLRVFISPELSSGEGGAEAIEGSHVMLAVGAKPLVEGLGLAAAGVLYGASGIKVDANLRSSNRRIYAIGAAAEGELSPGAAERHASRVLRHILSFPFGFAAAWKPQPSARVILTDPEIACSGLSEAQARKLRRHIRVLRWPYAATDRAHIERATVGHVKLLTSRSGKILGAGIVGPAAGELINLYTLAISQGMYASDLASIMVPYPTFANAVEGATSNFQTRRSAGAWRLPRFFRWLR